MTNIPTNQVPDHMPTVVVGRDGSLHYTSDAIRTSQDGKTIKVLPDEDEKIVSLVEHKSLFQNLEFADIILTNACNLSCTYCYEQHNRDFGRFTPDRIRSVWNWLRDINDNFPKYIQFFGGEPLIHSKLILDFMRENKDELERMKDKMAVSITTNGLLLTREFIDEFFSYPNVKMMISLDTIDASLDHRGIGQEKIDALLETIAYVATKVRHPDNLAVRATVTRAGSPYLTELWNALYVRGVRQLIFHPLILSLGEGYVEWPEEEWNQFSNDIKTIIRSHQDIEHFQVVEGVGAKTKTNCLVGSDEIAVDASGDFTGCYFFTNRKGDAAGKMLLGNIFDDHLYIDRYQGFKANYEAMYDQHDECSTCDVKNLCYQCPAGNMATSGKLFRPDGMCKRIITLYSDINELMMENKFKTKLSNMLEAYEQEGDAVLARAMVHLMYYFFEDGKADADEVKTLISSSGCSSAMVVRFFNDMLDYADTPGAIRKTFTPEIIVNSSSGLGLIHQWATLDVEDKQIPPTHEVSALYKKILECEGMTMNFDLSRTMTPLQIVVSFITAMHFVIMNTSEIRKRQ